MQSRRRSLLNYLRTENPAVDGHMCHGKGLTTSNTWETPKSIELWEDFEFKSLQAIYDGQLQEILNRRFILQEFSAIPQFPFREIHDEDSLESLLIKWNQSIVSHALSNAQDHLNNGQENDTIYMVKGGQAKYPDDSSRYRPDWGAVKRTANCTTKPETILPGETKLSQKWSSRKIKLGPVYEDYETTKWLPPVSQIFSYCVRSNSRYGYLITDEELVVVRIREEPRTDSQSAVDTHESIESSDSTCARYIGILEYQAIPWTKDTTSEDEKCKGMTMNLALWWLHMMAAEDSSIKTHYPPLPGVVRQANAKTKAQVKDQSALDGKDQDHSFTFSDMSSFGRRLSKFDFESPEAVSPPKPSPRTPKRQREEGVSPGTRKQKKPRS